MTAVPSTLLPSLSMLASALFWGSMWYPMRMIAAAGMPGLWSGMLAYGLMILPLLPLAFWRYRQLMAGGWALIATGASVAACNVLFAGSMVNGEVAMAILLFYLSPIWASLLERWILKTPFTRSRWVAIGVALLGMTVLQGMQGRLPWPSNLSEWFGVLAGMCWAVGLVFARVSAKVSVVDKSIVQFAFALPIGYALVVVMGEADLWPGFATLGSSMPWIVATTLFWVIPALVLSLWGAGRLSPGRASMLLMVEVLVGIGSASWLAGESLGWAKIVGGALIVSASIIDAWFTDESGEAAAA
jgi:drug/metabolite transporter (DMT)-like permease